MPHSFHDGGPFVPLRSGRPVPARRAHGSGQSVWFGPAESWPGDADRLRSVVAGPVAGQPHAVLRIKRRSRESPARRAGRPRPAPPARLRSSSQWGVGHRRVTSISLCAALPRRAGAGRPRPSGAGHATRSRASGSLSDAQRSRKAGAAILRGEFGLCDPRRSQTTTGASVRLTSVAHTHPYSPRRRAQREHERRRVSGPRTCDLQGTRELVLDDQHRVGDAERRSLIMKISSGTAALAAIQTSAKDSAPSGNTTTFTVA